RAPRPKRSLELNQRLSALFKRNLFVRVLVTRNLSESDCTEPLEKRGENVTVTKHGVPKPAGRRVASLKIDMEDIVRHLWLAFVPQWPAPKLRWFWLGLVVWNVAIGALIWNSTPGRVVPPSLPAEWAQVLFPLLFVVLWCFVSVLLAWIGGWGVLARHYPAR